MAETTSCICYCCAWLVSLIGGKAEASARNDSCMHMDFLNWNELGPLKFQGNRILVVSLPQAYITAL